MLGQLLIVCAIAHISIVLTNGKETKPFQSIRLLKSGQRALVLDVFMMLVGAVVESIAINFIWSSRKSKRDSVV